MLGIVLDVAGLKGQVGIIDLIQGQIKAQKDLGRGPHGGSLIPTLLSLCQDQGIQDLKEMACCITTLGPGSFTGVRLGIATARAFQLATGKPGVGISTLRGVAYQERKNAQARGASHILGIIDGKRQDVYAQIFRIEGEAVVPQTEAFSAFPEDLRIYLKEGETYWCAGDGLHLVEDILTSPLIVGASREGMTLQSLGELGRGALLNPPSTLHPLYVRPADVTLQKKKEGP